MEVKLTFPDLGPLDVILEEWFEDQRMLIRENPSMIKYADKIEFTRKAVKYDDNVFIRTKLGKPGFHSTLGEGSEDPIGKGSDCDQPG